MEKEIETKFAVIDTGMAKLHDLVESKFAAVSGRNGQTERKYHVFSKGFPLDGRYGRRHRRGSLHRTY